MKKFLLILLALLLAAPSLVAMTGARYSIPALIISGGGEENMTSDGHQAQDVKGQGVIGAGSSTRGRSGLGGIYTLGTGEVERRPAGPPVIVIAIEDIGRIRQTWIERTGDDVVLHWGYDPLGATDVRVHVRTDDGAYVDRGVTPAGTTRLTIPGLVGDSHDYYFRVVPEPLVDPDMIAAANNSITVAKLDYDLVRAYNLISVPLVTTADTGDPSNPTDQRLNTVIGDQLVSGNQVYLYNMVDLGNRYYNVAQYTGGTWGDPFLIMPGLGYWVFRDPEETEEIKQVSIVGRVINTDYTSRLENLYTLVGNPYPVNRNLDTFGLVPDSGDQVYSFLEMEDPQRYDISQYDGSAWDPLADVLPKYGYWYFKDGTGIDWSPPRP